MRENKKTEMNLSGMPEKSDLRRIFYLLTGYRGTYLTAIFLQGVSIFCKSSIHLLLSWFVDGWLLAEQPAVTIWTIAAAFFGCVALEALCAFVSNRNMNYTAENIARGLRDNFYDHIQRLSFRWHDKVDTGDLIVRATSDIDTVRKLFSEQIYGACRVSFMLLINGAMIFRIQPKLALSTLLIMPLVLGVSLFFFKKIGKVYDEYETQDSVVFTDLQEVLTGIRVVKAFSRQEYETERFDRLVDKRYEIGKKMTRTEACFWPATDILCWSQLAFSLFLGAKSALNGTISLGDLVAFESLVTMIIWPMRNLGRQIVSMSRAMISLNRLMEVFREPREDLEAGDASITALEGDVRFEHVSFAYDEIPVLQDVSFAVKKGETIAIMGATGSGKTSLINLLPGFYDYNEGSIRIDGHELRDIPKNTLRKGIGTVEQEPFLFSCTIAENISYGAGREVSREEIEAAAKAACIHESIIRFPNGYDTMVGERGVTLSGGQKQRIAIARALLKDPAILILDDSLSAVDTLTEASIRQALKTLMKDRTTFIIAHRTTGIMDAHRILVLEKGHIVQQGTHTELLAEEGHYRRIYEIQNRIEAELEEELSHE